MRILPFLFALPLLATTTVQQVTEVSAQQAIIRYRTTLSPSTACSHAVTETLSGSTPDNVNTTLFPGANLDTRVGSIINGQDRVFVAGLRYSPAVSAIGSDGNVESRSLKANTAYTDVITCGGDTATVYFNTGNVQIGSTYTEQPPFNSAGFGNWAWPSVNWSTQSKQYADPQTGAVIMRALSPGFLGKESGLTNFDFAIGGTGYTNPQNILQGASCAGTSSTCAQSANGNPIFVSMKGQNYTAYSSMYSSGYSSTQTYDDILVTLTGLASASGAEPVSVCLSYYDSGATCDTATQTITLGTGSVSTVGFPEAGVGYTAPNNQWDPVFQFGEWGGTAPKRGDFGMTFGTSGATTGVTTSGTAVTVNCHSTNASESCFNVKWNNAYFYIQGSGCTGPNGETDVCQINGHPTDTEHLTLKTAPVTACSSQCNWNSLAAGIEIAPNGAGTVDIGAQYSYAYSAEFALYINGISQVCNPVPVSVGYEADGMTAINPPVPGNLCMIQSEDQLFQQSAVLLLLIPSTGEIRLLSPLICGGNCDPADASGDQVAAYQIAQFQASAWDGVSGLCFYGTAPASLGPTSVYKGCYNTADNWKAYDHPLYACGNCGSNTSGVNPGQDPSYPSYYKYRYSDDPITYTNITPPSRNLGILQQIEANNTSYQSTIWGYFILEAVGNGTFTIALTPAQQGAPASIAIFSTSTGLIQSWGDTFFGSNGFCGLHDTEFTSVTPGYLGTSCNYLYFNNSSVILGGPFQSTPYWLCSGPGTGSCSTNTTLTSSSPLEACSNYTISSSIMALITENGAQNQCMHIRMKNVTSHTPSAAELALWPSSQNAAWSEPQVLQPGNTLALPNEPGLVAAVTTGVTDSQCSSDCLDVVVARGIPTFSNGGPPASEPNGWTAVAGPTLAACTNGGNCTPGVGAWIPLNLTGNFNSSTILDPPAFVAHNADGSGLASGKMTFVQAGYNVRYNQTLPAQAGSLAGANQITLAAPFSGKTGSITLQSYPSNEQYANPSNWFLDYNHTSPSYGGGGEQFITIDSITYSLVGGTSTVYKVTTPAGGLTPNEANYKTNGLQGWAGPNLLLDSSGPGSSLSDSTEYEVCMALASGECYAGSSAGNVYVTVPNVPGIQSNCITDWLVQNYPCAAVSLPNVTGALTQHDASYSYGVGESGRVLTHGLTGWGRQYEFNTFIPDSTGTWGFFKADWADGIRSEIFMARLPPFPGWSSIAKNGYINEPVTVPSGSMYAEVRFGYLENGAAAAGYCTARLDACTTSGSPFVYPSIDTRTLTTCTSGCTIQIPVISGRVVYYEVGTSSDGMTWTYGNLQAAVAPGG